MQVCWMEIIFGEVREKNTMKNVLIIILLFASAFPCFAELTKEDVRQIIRAELEPVKKDIEFVKIDIVEIKNDIKLLEGRMTTLEGKMALLEGKMATKDDIIALSEGMNTLYGVLISILVALIIAILSIFFAPSLKRWFEGLKLERDLRREETQRSKEIDELKRRIAELEKRKI